MGLDMYLTKKTHVKNWNFTKDEEKHEVIVKKGGKSHPKIKPERVCDVIEDVIYWRKANAIHGWFVDNCQNGVDECQKTEITRDQLVQLRDLCKEVIINKSTELLKPKSGFFFGSTEIDEYYYDKIQRTFNALENELSINESDDWDVTYFYRASW
jgi:hypothetical protein